MALNTYDITLDPSVHKIAGVHRLGPGESANPRNNLPHLEALVAYNTDEKTVIVSAGPRGNVLQAEAIMAEQKLADGIIRELAHRLNLGDVKNISYDYKGRQRKIPYAYPETRNKGLFGGRG